MTIAAQADGLGAEAGDRARQVAAPSGLLVEVVDGQAWDRLAVTFDAICQEQLHAFSILRWPRMDHEALVFRREGQVVGGALVMIRTGPLGLGGMAIVKWGPVVARGDVPDDRQLYGAMIDELVRRYVNGRRLMLSVLPRAEPGEANVAMEMLESLGFSAARPLPYPGWYLVRILSNADDQMASLGQKWRAHLRKSLKAGLDFEQGRPEDVDVFLRLYEAMAERKRFPDYSAISTLPGLIRSDVGEGRPKLFFVRHDGEIVAGAVVFAAGRTATYVYGATTESALPLRAGYFIQWQIMRWLAERGGVDWYDLGGTDGFEGLHQFKSGLVGQTGSVSELPPAHFLVRHPVSWAVGHGGLALKDLQRVVERARTWFLGGARPDQRR